MRTRTNWITMLVVMVAMPGLALATVDIEITWTTGAEPSNFGMGSVGDVSGADTTAPGVWHAAYSSGTAHFFRDNSASHVTPDGTVIHGNIDTEVFAWGNPIAHTLIHHGLDGQYFLELLAGDGFMRIAGQDIAVANSTGRHTYGWEVDWTNTPTVTVYFDGAQVGDAAGYAATANPYNALYLGRAAGGNTSQDWHSWTIQEGAIPEPASLSLLAAGAALLVARRRRA